MNNSVRRGAAGLAAGVAVVGLLAGCGDKVVKAGSLEKGVKSQLVKGTKIANPSAKVGEVKCDGDLKGKVGESVPCTASIDGRGVKLLATVTKVSKNNVFYNVDFAK